MNGQRASPRLYKGLTRRVFVGGLAAVGASAAGLVLVNVGASLPFTAQPRVARVGYLWSGAESNTYLVDAVRDGVRDAGWVEGQNLLIDYRAYGDHPERVPDLVTELIALKPDVIVTNGAPTALAFMRASDSIPIVVPGSTDPVGSGLVASLARPGGSVTGTTRAFASLGPKLLDLLVQLVPGLARVAVAFESANPTGVTEFREDAGRSIGIRAQGVGIASSSGLESALDSALADHPQSVIALASGGLIIPQQQVAIMGFALQYGLPSASSAISGPGSGGLLYYGADLSALYRRAATYHVDRILRGARPADLPVEGPTVFELIVNHTTAEALGITIPPDVAAQVTQWIQ
jgi:putative ABC transport system substrate-binding protein